MTDCYLAADDRLLAVRDATGDPELETLHSADAECVAVHPDAPDRVLLGTFEEGLWRSTDAGETFDRVARETIGPDAVTSVRIHPADPDLVWAGTEPSRVYRSTDGGATWTRLAGLTDVASADDWSFPPRPDTHHVRWLEPHPTDPGRWYVGIEAGALVVTPDGGETWLERPPGSRRDNHTLATHPDAPNRVYSAAGDGFARSTDAGESWATAMEGLEHRYVWGLAVDPGDPETVVASAASGAFDAHRNGRAHLYRRRGDGPWEPLDDRGVPVTYRAVLAGGTQPGELYALTDRGCYRTTDAGDAWTGLDLPWPEGLVGTPPRALAVVG